MILKAAGLAICGAAMLACNNLDELEQRVDSLESRIQALETQLPQLNENVSALSAILDDGNISSITVDSESGNLVITTTGGTTYELAQGSAGNAPDLSVDEDGYWIIRYAEDEEWQQITGQDGNPVLASSNAIMFGVSDDGYWEISYDGGKTYLPVYREDGQTRIPALEEDSDFFRDIEYIEEEQMLYLTLSDGKVIEVPVVSDFLVQIKNVTYGEAERFTPGQTRTFDVTMRGVEAADVKAPAGWKATLGDVVEETAVLTVTAPATTQTLTKVMADTETDVTILAVFTNGLSSMAKMTVGFSNSPGVDIKEGTHTATSVVFTVTPNLYATSYKYHLYPQATPAPASAEDFASAPEVTDNFSTPLTLTQTTEAQPADIAPVSTYVLYVLPLDTEGTAGTIQSKTATTPNFSSYYERYLAGQDIVIAGKTYNSETYGNATLVDSDETLTSTEGINQVYFVDSDATLTLNTSGQAIAKLVIIGNNPDMRSKVNITAQLALNQGIGNTDGTFVLYNLDVDASAVTNYVMAQNRDGAYGYVGIIGSSFRMPAGKQLSYVSSNARSFAEVVFQDSDIEIPSANQLMLFSFGSSTASHGKFVFRNCILYSEGGVADFRIYSGVDTALENFTFENNTVVNLWFKTNGSVLYNSLGTISVTKNLIWTNKPTVNACFFHPTDTSAETGPYTGNPTGTLLDDSRVYKNGESTNWQWFYGGNSRVNKEGFTACNEITPTDSDPLATKDFGSCTFTPVSEYAGYGAQRN